MSFLGIYVLSTRLVSQRKKKDECQKISFLVSCVLATRLASKFSVSGKFAVSAGIAHFVPKMVCICGAIFPLDFQDLVEDRAGGRTVQESVESAIPLGATFFLELKSGAQAADVLISDDEIICCRRICCLSVFICPVWCCHFPRRKSRAQAAEPHQPQTS